jgi:hypothetical protein
LSIQARLGRHVMDRCNRGLLMYGPDQGLPTFLAFCPKENNGALHGQSARLSVPMPMLMAALEQRTARVGAGGDVGDQIQDFLARQLVEQSFGHDRYG